MLRLTLRTLLAYLDDMLDPAQTKLIGQKVAESDTAQELVSRIKQVTRRRRLTTPPLTGPGSFDPNTVAEYLDDVLAADAVAEVERQALESDVHLAEIASVHQILTLVVGQPALIPPTARQRMYGLVRGREAVRRRARPQPVRETVGDGFPRRDLPARDDADESLLGLVPPDRGSGLARWLLPAAAGFLLAAVLGTILWGLWLRDTTPRVAQGTPAAPAVPAEPKDNVPPPPVADPGAVPPKSAVNEGTPPTDPGTPAKPPEPGATPPLPGGTPPGTATEPTPATTPPTPPVAPPTGDGTLRPGRLTPPDGARRELGRYTDAAQPTGFLARRGASGRWERLAPRSALASREPLVSLPGYRSDLTLDTDLVVTLAGHVPELTGGVSLFESAVTPHAPPEGYAADLTLDRGALRLRAPKATPERPVRARVRFLDQAWDLALEEPDTDLGLVLIARQAAPYDAPRTVLVDCRLYLLTGQATVGLGHETRHGLRPTAGPLVYTWDNYTRTVRGPIPPSDVPARLFLAAREDAPPATQSSREVRLALTELSRRIAANRPLEAALAEILQPGESSTPDQRRLAVRSLAALGSLVDVLNVAGDEQRPLDIRDDALQTLIAWLNHGDDRLLYDPARKAGLLLDRKFSPREAETFLTLLFPFSNDQMRSPETYALLIDLLRHDRLAIRQLAYWHLARFDPGARDQIRYNPAGTPEQLDRAAQDWKRRIPAGSLPPVPPRTAPPPPAG